MISIKKVSTESIPSIAQLAKNIWNISYKEIISQAQIDYMLDLMYSPASLQSQIQHQHHQFIFIYLDDTAVGFASYSIKNKSILNYYRLHKLYVLPNTHHKGFGKKIINYIIEDIRPKGATQLELNVNRQNPAVGFYKKMNFFILKEETLSIGNGYFMDDYIMLLNI